jgi:hypothetical protein
MTKRFVESRPRERDCRSRTQSGSNVGASVSTTADEITDDDLTRFIAAAEVPLQGTSLEGVVFEAPEIYIAIAQVSCARFSDGETFKVTRRRMEH